MVLIVLIVTTVLLGNTDIAEAQSVDDLVSVVQDELIFDQVIQQNLVNNSVADHEYLYNLDNSADYLYVTLIQIEFRSTIIMYSSSVSQIVLNPAFRYSFTA